MRCYYQVYAALFAFKGILLDKREKLLRTSRCLKLLNGS